MSHARGAAATGGGMGGQRSDLEIDHEVETGLITAHPGIPVLMEAFRQTGSAAVIDRGGADQAAQAGLTAIGDR